MAINDYDDLIRGAAEQYKIDPQLLKAVMWVESKGNPKEVNPKTQASGLMQFIPSTAQERGVEVFNPRSSIYEGARYISELLDQYGSPDVALDHYSGHTAGYGASVLDAYKTVPPPIPPGQTGETLSEREAHLPPQRNLRADAHGPDTFTLDKGQPGQPGATVRTTDTTPSAPSVPLTVNTAQSTDGMPPGLADIIKPTPTPSPQNVPGDDLPPGLSEIIKPTAKPMEEPAPAPAPTTPPVPTGPVPPPIYTAPSIPLIGKEGSPQAMPAPTGQPMPAITPENEAAFAGFSHGARAAVNPLLEFGSNIGNYIADRTGWDALRTDRVANDLASEQAFQNQYGNNKLATGAARATQTALPLVMGMGTGAVLRGGLQLAGSPAAAEFVSGTGGAGQSGIMPWLTRLGSGATAGATQGLVAGGPYGALIGAGLGATALPAIGAVANWVTGRTAGGAATQALQAIYRAAARDGMSPAQLDARIAALGPEATLADIGGVNLRSLAEGTANTPGPGMATAWDFLRSRAEGQTERLDQAVRTATGATGSAFENLATLQQARATAAAPRYEASFNRIRTTPEEAANVAPFIDDPIGQQALQRGLRIIQLEKLAAEQPFNPADYGVSQNADGSFELGPGTTNLRLMDAVKRGYDNIVEGYRDAVTGRLNLDQYGRAVNAARATYVGKLRDMFPRYGNALDAWGGPSADMDALSMGRRLLSTDADQTAANVAALTPSQRQMYQVGVAQSLRDRIESTADATDATRRIFGNTQIRNRIAAGFGGEDTDAFRNFRDAMERESIYADTHRQLLSGSPTARRAGAMQDAQNPPLTPGHIIEPAISLLSGGAVPAAMSVARMGINPLLSRISAPSERYSAALGNALFNPEFRFSGIPAPGPSIRNLLMGPVGQQGVQWLLNTNRAQPAQSP